jgi:hypothetical protein
VPLVVVGKGDSEHGVGNAAGIDQEAVEQVQQIHPLQAVEGGPESTHKVGPDELALDIFVGEGEDGRASESDEDVIGIGAGTSHQGERVSRRNNHSGRAHRRLSNTGIPLTDDTVNAARLRNIASIALFQGRNDPITTVSYHRRTPATDQLIIVLALGALVGREATKTVGGAHDAR